MTPYPLQPRRAAITATAVCVMIIAIPFFSVIWTKGSAFGFPMPFLLIALGLPVALVWLASFCAAPSASGDNA